MLNLIKFRDVADYGANNPEYMEPSVSGRDAYARYSAEAEGVFRKAGGLQLWIGQPQAILIGSTEERWDLAFVAYYPTVSAFVELVKSSEYQHATIHRSAATLDSRLICSAELHPGNAFAPREYLPSKK